MNFLFNNAKRTFGIIFFICMGMMAVALFMEHFLMLKPCMLCYMQRGAVLILGLIAAIGYLINPKNINIAVFSFITFVKAIMIKLAEASATSVAKAM